ncbi:MAG TPA: hypothetical protein VK844_01785 [Hyphomicrobiales bacterium]|nr:hypothetical protein [Hyphomicrobiales bacterium]
MSQSHSARRQSDSPAAVHLVRDLVKAVRAAQREYATFSHSRLEAM